VPHDEIAVRRTIAGVAARDIRQRRALGDDPMKAAIRCCKGAHVASLQCFTGGVERAADALQPLV